VGTPLHDVLSSLFEARRRQGTEAAHRVWEQAKHSIPALSQIEYPTDKPGFQFAHSSQLDELPGVEWLVRWEKEPIIPEEGLALLYGRAGSGKSFLSVDLAYSVGQKHPVIYLASEGQQQYKDRKNAWLRHHKTDEGQVYFLSHEGIDVLRLLNGEQVDCFIRDAATLHPKLIIIDTFIWAFEGGDENSAGDMQRAISACRRIQQALHCAVLLVHHSNKGGDDYRGSSVLMGAVDVALKLTENDSVLTLQCDKAKYAASFAPRRFGLVDVHLVECDKFSGQPIACPVLLPASRIAHQYTDKLTENQREVLIALEREPFKTDGATPAELHDATGVQRTTIYSTLDTLVQRKLVQYKKALRGKQRWVITDKGRELLSMANATADGSSVTESQSYGFNWLVS
jgi:DNA-binding MarR family transcriptional regulator